MTDTPTNTILLRGLPSQIDEKDVSMIIINIMVNPEINGMISFLVLIIVTVDNFSKVLQRKIVPQAIHKFLESMFSTSDFVFSYTDILPSL